MPVQSATSHRSSVTQIVDAWLDMLLITETWHENTESVSLKRVTPNGYKWIDAARPLASEHVHKAELQNYGGIALVYRDNVTVTKYTLGAEPATFEHLCVDVTTEHDSLLLLCVYRPGSQAVTAEFFDELTSVLERDWFNVILFSFVATLTSTSTTTMTCMWRDSTNYCRHSTSSNTSESQHMQQVTFLM